MSRLRKIGSWPLLLLLNIGAIAAIVHTTRMGIGLDPDSTSYLGAARNILAGRGLSLPFTAYTDANDYSPMTHFPPLYPLLLAGFGLGGIELPMAARIVAALLFALNISLAGGILYWHTRRWLLTAIAVCWLGSALDLLMLHSMAWSEPLFILLTLVTILLLSNYAQSPNLPRLLGVALSASLAMLCRYAGAPWLLVGTIAPLIWGPRLWRHKIEHAGLFLLSSLGLVGAWFLRNWWLSGEMVIGKAGVVGARLN